MHEKCYHNYLASISTCRQLNHISAHPKSTKRTVLQPRDSCALTVTKIQTPTKMKNTKKQQRKTEQKDFFDTSHNTHLQRHIK